MKTYTHLKDRPLIYGIINTVNSKIYIGKTKCIYKRCAQYIYDFGNRVCGHLNDHLFNAMTKYGIENFDMVPIEFCNLENIAERELYWINYFKSNDRMYGYNLRLDSRTGMIAAPETIEKIRRNLKEQWVSGKRRLHGAKVSAKWDTTPERKEKMRTYFRELITKWKYIVTFPNGVVEECRFQRLKELGLGSVFSNFHRTKQDSVVCKHHKITRLKI